jgi:SAM-dependent methyltransferase
MNPFSLYERSVTNSPALLAFILAAYAQHSRRAPRVLREDFSGSAALARHFAASARTRRAIAVDNDPEALAHAAGQRMTLVLDDVMRANDRADIIAATNFPLGYWHTRRALVKYLAKSRQRLLPDGLFIADMYGGHSALRTGTWTRTITQPGEPTFLYRWRQIEADPTTGMVKNAIDFGLIAASDGTPERRRNGRRVTKKGVGSEGRSPQVQWITNAFTYHWRLWSMPELREAMSDAGFRHIDFYDSLGDAIDHEGNAYIRPLRPEPMARGIGIDLDRDWVIYAIGRAQPVRDPRRARR